MLPRKSAKFENPDKIFQKCPLWSIVTKLENIWITFFFTGSWPEIVWLKQHYSNFDSTSLTCDPALFPGKNISNIAKGNRIFPGKGRGDIILTHYCLFISIWAIFRRERGVKVGPKVLTLGSSLFHKYSNPSENFQTAFLFARELPLVRISAIWESKGPKTSQKGLFRGWWIGKQNFGIWYKLHICCTDETYHDYQSSWECKPRSS